MIRIKNLNKKFGKIYAVKNLSLHVKRGKIHALIGPEASGKSTVLRILATLMRPDSGEVTIDNIPLSKGAQIRNIIGYVPKIPSFPLDTTAKELITFAASLHGIRDKSVIQHVLKERGLDAVADQTMNRYSLSMKKNVAIAIALVHDPPVLLLDEPMAGLDPISYRTLKEYIISSKKTVLLTEKDLSNVEGLCDSVTVLRCGSMVVDDELSSLRQKIGKIALELRLYDMNQAQKLLFELEKEGAKLAVSGDSIFISLNSEAEIPRMIRVAANTADIREAKTIHVSIDDIFGRFLVEGENETT